MSKNVTAARNFLAVFTRPRLCSSSAEATMRSSLRMWRMRSRRLWHRSPSVWLVWQKGTKRTPTWTLMSHKCQQCTSGVRGRCPGNRSLFQQHGVKAPPSTIPHAKLPNGHAPEVHSNAYRKVNGLPSRKPTASYTRVPRLSMTVLLLGTHPTHPQNLHLPLPAENARQWPRHNQ
ncbi:hypothetical protein DFH94DRAFT_418089 [Russula ochroleuca]|uniref:Uncharacterized protein n=1 Tax=Russula ochroleuca TaxID=152965 RepID=A0A9P5MYR1_9AGAM|nr:hypothetical protein DFH94DRAFT_418089 [Russula ochroleuca]